MKFAWDDVQKQARREGELVYAMDQGQTPILLHPNPERDGVASAGFCVGLAMRWIGLRHKKSDYPYDPKTRVSNGEFREAVRDQNISRNSRGAWPARFQNVLGQYRAPVDFGRSRQVPETVSGALLYDTIAVRHGLYYFELRGPKSAHAIAIESEPGGFHLFDGNEGHFHVQRPSRFRFFLTRFLNKVPGRYREKYTVATWIAVVAA